MTIKAKLGAAVSDYLWANRFDELCVPCLYLDIHAHANVHCASNNTCVTLSSPNLALEPRSRAWNWELEADTLWPTTIVVRVSL